MTRTAVAAGLISAALLVAACGGPSDQELASVTGGTTASSLPVATTPGGSATAAPYPSGTGPASTLPGQQYTDPDGLFSIRTGPTWKRTTSAAVNGPVWALGPAEKGDLPIVWLGSEDLTTAGTTVTAADYMKATVTNLRKRRFTVVRTAVISGSAGKRLGAVEYTGVSKSTQQPVHQLVVFDLNATVAAYATLRTPEKSYRQYRSKVLPYLRSIAVT